MTMFEEIRNGLQSGLDAYENGEEMRSIELTADDEIEEQSQEA